MINLLLPLLVPTTRKVDPELLNGYTTNNAADSISSLHIGVSKLPICFVSHSLALLVVHVVHRMNLYIEQRLHVLCNLISYQHLKIAVLYIIVCNR